jgi:hypothetical protein
LPKGISRPRWPNWRVFDPEKETITGDAEANRMLTREYRKPYALPDKV